MLDWSRSITNFIKTRAFYKGSSSYQNKEKGDMWLFVGLGNPGAQYAKNRHNIGFLVLDAIIDQNSGAFPDYRAKFQGAVSEGRIKGQKVVLLKPRTYMNNSGQSVRQAAKFYKIEPCKIIVFHDELDIPQGDVRIKQGGGTAGHNGLKSIQTHLNTPDFWRVRIGIGRPEHKGQVSNYVLNDFSKTEIDLFAPLVDFMGDKVGKIIEENPVAYQTMIKEYMRKNRA